MRKISAETLHLPKTSFQMKGNLPNKEPNYIKMEEHKIYEKGLAKGKESFILARRTALCQWKYTY